ncbi:aspartate aminotransferase [Aspergillus terreus NIH2624]|uniref:aspartate transaminase n=1 Tax=Aspergillus terreus (strain NIH 2624 / FGSC A1156) TaxID=341663 RepID=Q0CPI2_ASPTN|nr:aspartate aminotransferase [Aspergillus terreus NIH2624]EAU34849.1 aspartate aminotransferase [Aspergillus terreus NIH2624]
MTASTSSPSSSSSSSSSSIARNRLASLSSHIMGSNPPSVFSTAVVPAAPEDPLFGLAQAFRQDPSAKKVDLVIGAYRDNNAKPWVLPVVKKADDLIRNDPNLNHEYLPIKGLADYTTAAQKLMIGADSPAIRENRVATFQPSPAQSRPSRRPLLAKFHPQPAQAQDLPLQPDLGQPPPDLHQRRASSSPTTPTSPPRPRASTSTACWPPCAPPRPAPSSCCTPAPTTPPASTSPRTSGSRSPSSCATASCSPSSTAPTRVLRPATSPATPGPCATSSTRASSCASRSRSPRTSVSTASAPAPSTLCPPPAPTPPPPTPTSPPSSPSCSAPEISNPPAYGARIASRVLNDPALFAEWEDDLRTMSGRIADMRTGLRQRLEAKGTPGSWAHITDQIGMFSFTGLSEQQVKLLRDKWHVYMTKNGRISMAGLNTNNLDYFAEAVDSVVRETQ